MFSRIHVEDIASVLEASMTKPRAGAIYNVADDGRRRLTVVAYAAELLGVARHRRSFRRRRSLAHGAELL